MGKFGKFVFLSAVSAAVGAATYCYLQENKYPIKKTVEEDDDFDDFSDEDLEKEFAGEGASQERSYVNITPEKVQETAKKVASEAKDIASFAYANAKDLLHDAKEGFQKYMNESAQTDFAGNTAEKVEEFFDDEDTEELPEDENL